VQSHVYALTGEDTYDANTTRILELALVKHIQFILMLPESSLLFFYT